MLDRPVYGYAETDRLLRLSSGTAKRWINGYRRGGRWYEPVIRDETTDSAWVTWGEFTETRLLAEFRPDVPMIKLRPAVQWLKEHLRQQYPLAYAYPYLHAEGRQLLLRAQKENDLDPDLWLTVGSDEGVLLTTTSRRFTDAVKFPDDLGPAEAIVADPGTPNVLLHPALRQGQPTVQGIRAQTLAEAVTAGEPLSFVAATYGLPVELVEEAVTYEASRRRAA